MPIDFEHEQLKRLYDYTKFHIGLYATLITALLALMSIGAKAVPEEYKWWVFTMAVAFLFAGACGGIVAVNTFRHSSYEALMAKDEKAELYGKETCFDVVCFARAEHLFFWIGISIGFVAVVYVSIFGDGPAPAKALSAFAFRPTM